MAAIFEMTIESEMLTRAELSEITGASRRCDQIGWLDAKGWRYVQTKAGEPVVGRLYARLMLAGISVQGMVAADVVGPDMSKVR